MLQFRFFSGVCTIVIACGVNAQQVTRLTLGEYQVMKAAGELPERFHVAYSTTPTAAHAAKPAQAVPAKSMDTCSCWLPVDNSYTLALDPADDASTSVITLPFTFDLMGDTYNSCYINNNGNVSFGTYYWSFTAASLPTEDYAMVAPFWADVDTRADSNGVQGGSVWYKVTAKALYVTWDSVGYYGQENDKRNSFQVILTDGTDPVIGIGNNVGFCYGDMQWTTGQASCAPEDTVCTYGGLEYSCNNGNGLGLGFCGYDATVGVNRGNAIDYLQITTTDHPGTDYDGPGNGSDGVDWLDGKRFIFNTATATNRPPLAVGTGTCDTLHLCWADPVDVHQTFLAPEVDQNVEVDYSVLPPLLAAISETITGTGASVDIDLSFTPEAADTGLHVVTFTAADNGQIPLIRTVQRVVDVGCYTVGMTPPADAGATHAFIAPQPMTGRCVLRTADVLTAQDRVLLTDARGRTLGQWHGNGTRELAIERGDLSTGIYVLRILRQRAAEEEVRVVVQ